MRLLLLGERETGKSSAGNAILGGAGRFQAGVVTEECVRRQAEVAGRLVTVVDTPGWEAGRTGGTTERVKREMATSVGLCPPGPHALLLTLRVDTLVVAGHVRDHLELLGEGVWRHTLLLFTHGDQLRDGVDIQQHVQGGGRDLRWLLEKCRGRYRVISGLGGGEPDQAGVAGLLQEVEQMAVMNRCEAFSSLVHEVRVLSQRRSEKFSQRVKEMGEKMRRQEAELKKMREREVKSIRWIFERRKKGRIREKSGVQREEEEEDGRSRARRTDYGELEERIRWLAEDKEREIQELSLERERVHVALSQSVKERDNATIRLELKERELEEMKERMEELQLKLLHLECAGVEREEERKRREESMKPGWRGGAENLVEDVELQNYTMERRMEGETEAQLLENEQQQEGLRRKTQILDRAKQGEGQMEIRVDEMEAQHEKEVERREVEVEMMELQHREEMERKTSELRKIQEELKAQHQKVLEEMEADKKQHKREKMEVQQEKEREVAELKQLFANEAQARMRDMEGQYQAQMEKKALESEGENERIQMNFREEMAMQAREKEEEIELLTQQHREEMERRQKEAERREEQVREMEKAVEELKKECEDKIGGAEKDAQSEIKELRQQFEREIEKVLQERQRLEKHALELEERAAESHKAKEEMSENHKIFISRHLKERDTQVEELRRQHGNDIQEKTQEKDRIKQKLQRVEDEKRDLEEKHVEGRREMEVMKARLVDQLRRTAEERETDERHLQEKLEEKEKRNETLNQRMEEMKQQLLKERESRECGETKWRDEQRRKDKEIKTVKELIEQKMGELTEAQERLAKRERETEEVKTECESYAEQLWRKDAEMEEKVKEREEEMQRLRRENGEKKKEVALLRLRIEQTKTELKDVSRRMEEEMTGMIQEYERELQRRNLLVAEYGHAQRRTEELQEQKEEMRQEAESLRLKLAEVERRFQEHQQQVENREADVRGKDEQIRRLEESQERLRGELEMMAEKKEEAEQRARTVREEFQGKLGEKRHKFTATELQIRAEASKREEEVAERERAGGRKEEAPSERGCECQRKEEERVDKPAGPESDREEKTGGKEERRMAKEGRNNHQAEGVKGVRAEVKEGREGTDTPSRAEVRGDSQFLSAGRGCRSSHGNGGSQGSDLRVLVLGESWSAHAPGVLSILCGETSEADGRSFRQWRGEVAGHRLSVVEPLGLKWRDGPGPDKAEQRKSLLEGVWRCRPAPHVILLLLPAFLTCTRRLRSAVEEQVGWLGEDVWRRALLLFTWGDVLGESVEQHVLRSRELTELVGKCQGRYHMVTSGNNNNALVGGLLEKMEDIVATNRF